MIKKIIIFLISLLFILSFVLAVRAKYFTGSGNKVPEVSKERKLELQNKILQVQNYDYQIRDLSTKRDQLVNEINQEIDKLFKEYKLDKKDYTLDNNINFVPISQVKK